jgi:PAS domain S-box-containing protein
MKVSFAIPRQFGLAIAICCAGMVLAWLSGEASCLLAAVTAVCIYGGRSASTLSIAICALAFVLLLLAPGPDIPAEARIYLRTAAFVAAALVVSLMIQRYQTSTSSNRAEEATRLIVESMPGFGWSTDSVGNFKYVNPSVLEYLRTPRENLDRAAGTDTFGWENLLHPDDVEDAVKAWLHSLKTGEPFQSLVRIRRFDGTHRWFRNAGRPSRDHTGQVTGWYGTTIDIDEQKKAEEALRRSEYQFRVAINTIPTLVWAARPDGSADFFNMRWLDYTGLTLDEARDWGWVAAIHPDDFASLGDTWRTIIASGDPGEAEARLRRSDGEYRWFLFRAEPMRDGSGDIVKWYGTNTDIEERKQAEQRAQEVEKQLRAAIDTIPVIVWTALPDGTNDFHNQRLLSYTRFSPEQAQGTGWKEMFHPDDLRRHVEAWASSVETGNSFECESRLRRADGQYRWFLARAQPMRDASGNIVKWYGTNVDIDDRKRAEQELQRAHAELAHAMRVATLGEMAASIVHEVNQPIAAIVTNGGACLNWLRREPPALDEVRTSVEAMIIEGHRTGEVVRRLRVLAKKGDPQKELLEINDVIRESLLMVERELTSHNVTARTELSKTLPPVLGDRVQLQQVIINLIMNGVDAMSVVADRPRQLLIRSEQNQSDQVIVAVQDCGIGISSKDLDRLFDAFFTTKPNGLGMGLRVCRTIVEAHGGNLWASRNADIGATFQFSLPKLSRGARAGSSQAAF